MLDRGILAAKLGELEDRVARVREHAPASPTALRTDRDAQDLVAFNPMLAVQTCSDVAAHVIAAEGWIVARTLREGFERLHQQGVLSKETGDALAGAVGLRDVVAHGYAGVDVARLHHAATAGLAHLDAFGAEVAAWLRARP
ncbi:MAG: DUF86 domain-containing protein [Polyangiaceae bacterium]|nr:DUF86 domain-containing protein [Polyangiaceae bacterium]